MDGFGLKIQWRQSGGEYGDKLQEENRAEITLVFDGREIQTRQVDLQDIPKQASWLLADLVKLVEARQQLRGTFGDDVVNVV